MRQDPSKNLDNIFINEGDVYNRTDGTQYSYVTVVDTNTQEVLQQPASIGASAHASRSQHRYPVEVGTAILVITRSETDDWVSS